MMPQLHGSVLLYADMKRNNVPAELHVYETGGHGYGTRERPNSNIGYGKTAQPTGWNAGCLVENSIHLEIGSSAKTGVRSLLAR